MSVLKVRTALFLQLGSYILFSELNLSLKLDSLRKKLGYQDSSAKNDIAQRSVSGGPSHGGVDELWDASLVLNVGRKRRRAR